MRGDRGNRAESDGYPPLRIARHGGAESGLLVGIFLYGKDDEAVPYALILPCLSETVGGEVRYLPGDVRDVGDGVRQVCHTAFLVYAPPLQSDYGV